MRSVALVLATAALVAACSPVDEAPPASTDSDKASCSQVWTPGQTLPEGYNGCVRDDGGLEVAVFVDCSDGGRLTSYQDQLYAIAGGPVHEASDPIAADPRYKRIYDRCLSGAS